MKKTDLILNPFFLIGLFLLMINDFYLKSEFSNLLTGKISDFAGLLIFPMFIAALVPKLRKYISIITGLSFLIWKLPIITPLIDLINSLLPFTINRVIDYSDYIALLILPFSHFLINTEKVFFRIEWNKFLFATRLSIGLVAVFAFCATTIPYREMPKGTIYIGESYNIKMSKDSILNKLNSLGFKCDYYSPSANKYRDKGYYQITDVVRTWNDSIVIDTILNVKFDFVELNPTKTKITIINVTLSNDGNIQNWKYLKTLSKQYNQWMHDNLIEKIKK